MDALLWLGNHPVVLLIILVALFFDFLNGMHDAANSIATVVSTRVLSPRLAVLWAAAFNFAAYFLFETAVAKTMGSGLIDIHLITNSVIVSALLGACLWQWLTVLLGLPISSSHSLIGGLIGAAIAQGGWGAVLWGGKLKMIALFIMLAPVIGFLLGFLLMVASLWSVVKCSPRWVDRIFRALQLASSAAYSLGHGANDAQKTAGIILTLLIINGRLPAGANIPPMVVFVCYAVIGLGTMAGGWRIIKTLGMRMTHLQPIGGFSAETGAAMTLLGTACWGIPVSTTHTITGAIMGVGATRRLSAVRWGVALNIVTAWVITIPFAAGVAALVQWGLTLLHLSFLK